jgi:multiple sugar transport system substrate-binding protein
MKRKWSKGFTFLLLAFALVVTACSGGNGGNNENNSGSKTNNAGSSDSGSSSKPTEMSIMWWGPDARHEATLAALDIYSKQNAGITFKAEYLAWDAFWQKLPTLAASKSVTDILQMDAAFIQDYAARGVLADLSDIDLSGIVADSVIENLKIDGKLYGIPLSLNAQGHAYNKVKLEEYGIALPKKDWTWDDYFQFARDARAKLPEGIYPIGDTTTWDGYQYYQTAMGKGPIMQDGGKTFNMDKELFLKFFNTYAEFREQGIVPPAELGATFLENDPQADPMASGKVMTRGASVGSVAALEQLMPGQVGVVNVPTGPAGGGWAQSTIFLSVSTDSKNPDEAKKFVKWFITDPEAGKALGLTRGVPINEEIYKSLEPTLEPKDKIGKELYDVSVDKALPFYGAAAGWTEWVDYFKVQLEEVAFGQQSVEQAYENIAKLGEETAAKAASAG